MEAKEKAKELVNKYDCINFEISAYKNWVEAAKQCALIAVEELINSTVDYLYPQSKFTRNTLKREYWQEVKQELLKL
jgi:hypothetical protein